MPKRKHCILVEVTFPEPVTERKAVALTDYILMPGYLGGSGEPVPTKVRCKSLRRTVQAMINRLVDTAFYDFRMIRGAEILRDSLCP